MRRRAPRRALFAIALAFAGSLAAVSCSLLVGDETISGHVIDAGSGGSTTTTGSAGSTLTTGGSGGATTTTTTTTSSGGSGGGGAGGCVVGWTQIIAGSGSDVSLARDTKNNRAVLAATVSGPVTVGGVTLDSPDGGSDHDILVVGFQDDGAISFKQRIGGPGEERVAGVAADKDGTVYLAVNYDPVLQIAPDCMTTATSSADAGTTNFTALVKLGANGECIRAHDMLFGAAEMQGIAIAPGAEDVWTVAETSGSLSVGHWGDIIMGPTLGGGPKNNPLTLALAAIDSTAFVVGGFQGSLSDYEQTAMLQSAGGSTDAFVIRFLGTVEGDGGVSFGDGAYQAFRRAATDGFNLFVVGDTTGSIDLGDGGLQTAGKGDVIVARLTPGLGVGWSARFGGVENEKGNAIAVSGNTVAIGGDHEGGFGIGPTQLMTYGNRDALVAALDANDGAPKWACSFGGSGDDLVTSVLALPGGAVLAAGTFSDMASFGTTVDGGNGAIFLVKVGGDG
jgi:hypothetical protein